MDEFEMDRRVRLARLCLHNRKHYLDDNGNRRCFSCDAFVRPNATATITDAPAEYQGEPTDG